MDRVKYRVSFEIEGEILADGIQLSEDNLRRGILHDYSVHGLSYWGNRDIDTTVSSLKIEEVD